MKRRKHAMQAGRLEKDNEGIDVPRKAQANPSVGLETHYLDTLTRLNEGPMTPVNLVCAAKLEFEQRRSPRWDWINQRSIAHRSLQMRVRPNIVSQPRWSAG